ncbi:MAG: sigma factor G inhibitor Gin [Bacillota bacterium]
MFTDFQKRCTICGRLCTHAGALIIRGRIICPVCEKGILSVQSGNAFYEAYMNGLKKIWRCFTA